MNRQSYNFRHNQDYPEFKKSLSLVKEFEGGYVNDPDDPGGETKYGISKRAFPDEDIKNLTEERAEELYYMNYWWPMCCDLLLYPNNLILFDTAVLHGVYRTQKWAKIIKGWPDLLDIRRRFYAALVHQKPSMKKFYTGWINRVRVLEEEVKKYGVS